MASWRESCNGQNPGSSDAAREIRGGRARPIDAKWVKREEGNHAHLATGRMVETAGFLARRRGQRTRPLGGAGGPDRWRRKGDYPPDLAAQVGAALKRIIKLLGEAGAGPEHIVRLTWYLTSRSEYEAAGAGIGAAWKETLGRNFPPSTLLYIGGLVDTRAKVEIEVTAFVPGA
jgi:enamine deaminase RidA (YjgF/YER057c/UK114 family)